MLRRRGFIGACAWLAAPGVPHAQQRRGPARIGRLSPVTAAAEASSLAGFREGMRAAGRAEGTDYVIMVRHADGDERVLPALAAELVREGVDIILAGSNAGALAAKRSTSAIPIVVVTTGNPIAAGVVRSLARPGGNLTGVTSLGLELNGKRLDLLRELLPSATRWAFLNHMGSQYERTLLDDGRAAARRLGVELKIHGIRDAEDFEAAFARMRAERIEALIVPTGILFLSHRTRLAQLAAASRLPAIYAERRFVDAGGLVFYGASLAGMYQHAAILVDKVLKGAAPGALPFEQPSKFELAVNLKAAMALGIAVPEAILLRADVIIE